ncbi:hypothetical protein BC939DRAFT_182490 [Gamsiella multidivaricata]|uniref:uncharacterized protein n=1 Tax=Gamsiella multidivaricata TaxID=101098 RepID=UPI00222125F6|nr:uncharacterized protein BC939DRAFT_182490 [Gamsiella multidivaricata]KAI7822363.1 hypothetical protein BC939DRAFT_182490 [Gamsiella multidivaricata]
MFSPPPITTQEWVENLSLPLGELPSNDILSVGPVTFHPLMQAHSRKLVRMQRYYMHFFTLNEASNRINCRLQYPNGEQCAASYAIESTTQNLEGHLRGKHMEVSQAIDLFRTYQMDHRERLQQLNNTDTGNSDGNTNAGTPRRKGRTISKGKLKRKAFRPLSSVKLLGMSAEKTQELSLLALALAVS